MENIWRTLGFVLSTFPALVLNGQLWEVFDGVSAGFPSSAVTSLAEDQEHNIWVGTEWGLCRYDGVDWTFYQTSNSGLLDNRIEALAVDSTGNIWVGTVLAGVQVFDGVSGWTYFNADNSPLPDDQIKCIAIDHRGWVWIGTFLGVVCYTGAEWRIYNDTPESFAGLVLNGAVIEDIQVRADGLVAIATLNGGFHYLTDTLVDVHATYIDDFFDNSQMGVAFDTVNDQRWLVTPSHGLVRNFGDWYGGFWFNYEVSNSLIQSNSLTSIAIDPVGRPWMGSLDAGVMLREPDDEFISYTPANSGMPVEGVSALMFADDASLWIGTYGGGAVRMTNGDLTGEPGLQGVSSQIQVYPNPTEGICRVVCSGVLAAPIAWTLLDTRGQMVMSGTMVQSPDLMLDISPIAKGVYMLTLVGVQGFQIVRVTKA